LDQNAIVRRTIFVFSDEKGLQAWRGMGVDGEQGLQRAAVLMQGDVADDGELNSGRGSSGDGLNRWLDLRRLTGGDGAIGRRW
jgi:hypothetical protein